MDRLFCFAMQRRPDGIPALVRGVFWRRRKMAGPSPLRRREGRKPFTLWPDQAIEQAARVSRQERERHPWVNGANDNDRLERLPAVSSTGHRAAEQQRHPSQQV